MYTYIYIYTYIHKRAVPRHAGLARSTAGRGDRGPTPESHDHNYHYYNKMTIRIMIIMMIVMIIIVISVCIVISSSSSSSSIFIDIITTCFSTLKVWERNLPTDTNLHDAALRCFIELSCSLLPYGEIPHKGKSDTIVNILQREITYTWKIPYTVKSIIRGYIPSNIVVNPLCVENPLHREIHYKGTYP